MLHTLSLLFALAGVVAMLIAIGGMVSGREGALAGWTVRTAALACFAAAVALNVAAH